MLGSSFGKIFLENMKEDISEDFVLPLEIAERIEI
jgi:hypothetical protein